MRFYLSGIISFAMIVAGVVWVYLNLFNYSISDETAYRTLVQQTNPQATQKAPYKARQSHENVQKDIWFTPSDSIQKHLLRLYSEGTEFILNYENDRSEIIENMQHVDCYLQEKFYFLGSDGKELDLALESSDKPMQQLIYFQANSATYSYQSGHLLAYDVHFFRFAAPGHDMNENLSQFLLLFEGNADKLEISLQESNLEIKAHNLKANLFEL